MAQLEGPPLRGLGAQGAVGGPLLWLGGKTRRGAVAASAARQEDAEASAALADCFDLSTISASSQTGQNMTPEEHADSTPSVAMGPPANPVSPPQPLHSLAPGSVAELRRLSRGTAGTLRRSKGMAPPSGGCPCHSGETSRFSPEPREIRPPASARRPQ